MQFNFVFKDKSGRIKYNGSDVAALSTKITESATLSSGQLRSITKYAYEEWKKAINDAHFDVAQSRTPWSSRDYRSDLLAGISKSVSSNAVSFKIEGDKALAAELGWGVPNGGSWADGIGLYDGHEADLRPWLLHGGHPGVKSVKYKGKNEGDGFDFLNLGTSRTGATMYRVLRFDAPELSQMIETTAEHLTQHYDAAQRAEHGAAMQDAERQRFKAEKVKTLTHTARSRLEADASGNLVFKPLSYSSVPPSRNTHTYGDHMHWVYDRATLASKHLLHEAKDTPNDRRISLNLIMKKAKFSVFRTITDSRDQINAGLFFTKGIKPANTMHVLKEEIIPHALYMMLVRGRNPDGSFYDGD